MSEVVCLNGKHCVDTFLDLEKFYDSTDNVKLIQQACQLKWNPVEKICPFQSICHRVS